MHRIHAEPKFRDDEKGQYVTYETAKRLRDAVDSAAYALFQVKRMAGATDGIINHVSAAHEKACNTLNEIDDA